MYCVYCNEDHQPDVKFSPEHIIPKSLGGVDSFTIPICERVNNRVGNEVDAPFGEMFPVNVARFLNDLESHRGMPTLDLSGTTIINGKEVPIQSTVKDGQKVLRIAKPSVETTPVGDCDLKTVSGDPERVKDIMLGMYNHAIAKGKAIVHRDGVPVTPESIDRLVAEESVEIPNPSILIKLNLDGAVAVRFLAKVVLATGFYVAGETFGRSTIAAHLRTLMNSADITLITWPGLFWPFMQRSDAFDYFTVPDCHVIALLPDEPNVLAVSLFNGDYTALVPLIGGGAQSLLPQGQGRVFQIFFTERRMKTWEYRDYLLARPWNTSSSQSL